MSLPNSIDPEQLIITLLIRHKLKSLLIKSHCIHRLVKQSACMMNDSRLESHIMLFLIISLLSVQLIPSLEICVNFNNLDSSHRFLKKHML